MKTIVWDIDDVLNDLTRAWFETAWLPAHRECRLTYEELKVNPPHELLGTSEGGVPRVARSLPVVGRGGRLRA